MTISLQKHSLFVLSNINRELFGFFFKEFSFFFLFFFILSLNSYSQKNCHFNKTCQQAYLDASRMKVIDAHKLLKEAQQKDSENLAYKFVENFADLVLISVKTNTSFFEIFKTNCTERIEEFENSIIVSPIKNAMLAEMYFHKAIARLMFNEKFRASLDIRKAQALIIENKKSYPDFSYNYKVSGILNLVVASIPDNLKWAVSLISLSGNIDQGIREIDLFYYFTKSDSAYQCFFPEAVCLKLATMQVFDPISKSSDKPKIVFSDQLVQSEILVNKLLLFVCSDFMMKNGMNDKAIELLLNQSFDDSYLVFDYLDYITGIALQNKLDPRAPSYLFKYVINSSNRNYIKASYQRIAWHYLLNNNSEKYKEYMSNVLSFGLNNSESDNAAFDEASSGKSPNSILLKARLLFDGGYYAKSQQVIEKYPFTNVLSEENIEYAYRLARIYHETGQFDKAIHYYNIVISQASEKPWFYAANSCLMAGLLCEINHQTKKAIAYYEQCLKINPEKYKISIHQKAKAGKNRILN